MSTLASIKLYGRVALMRRRVLFRQVIRRAISGALVVAALIIAFGFATDGLFLTIRGPLGDLGATFSIAALYFVGALLLLAYTLHEPHSPELDALEEMEAAALEKIAAETQGAVQMFNTAGQHIENLGNGITLGLDIFSTLRKLLSSSRKS